MAIHTITDKQDGFSVEFSFDHSATEYDIENALEEIEEQLRNVLAAKVEAYAQSQKPRKVFSNFAPSKQAAPSVDKVEPAEQVIAKMSLSELTDTLSAMNLCQRLGGSTFVFNKHSQSGVVPYLYTVKENKWSSPSCDEGTDAFSLLTYLADNVWGCVSDQDREGTYSQVARFATWKK